MGPSSHLGRSTARLERMTAPMGGGRYGGRPYPKEARMSEFTDRLADALSLPRLEPDQQVALLAAARDVAHASDRTDAPLSAFLLGAAAAASEAVDPLAAVLDVLDRTLATGA
jgi:hypothetical protein